MQQGDIVLVPFPFSDLSAIKTRPALIISKNNNFKDVVVLAITSQKHKESIKIKNKDLSSGLLPVVSFIRYKKVASLDKSIVRKVVSKLKNNVTASVIKKFKSQF